MEKPKYIQKIEKEDGIFSEMELNVMKHEFKSFVGKKLEVVHENTFLNEKMEIEWKELIYKTAQPFYIYLHKQVDGWDVFIYYKPNQINELKIFLTQLLKQFKNATINNN